MTFILAIIATALLVMVGFCWMSWRVLRRPIVALAGGVFLASFVVIRASSFHHIDHLLGTSFVGLKLNWILELGGISLVGLSAVRNWRADLETTPFPFQLARRP